MIDDNVLVDGVRSVAFRSGVYRIAFFRFDSGGNPEPVLSPAVPQSCVSRLDAFNRMRR